MSSSDSYNLIEHLLFPPTRVNRSKLTEEVKGKTVLITGASYGIGESLAYALSKSGANLILIARTAEKLEAVKTEIEANGGKAIIFPVDLTKTEQIEDLLNELQKIPNGIDIFVNNAGKSIRRPLMESLDRFHDFTRTMNLNYFAPVRLALGLIPVLRKNHGQIVNISAVNVTLLPAPYWAAYQASKTAFDQWFRCAAPELEAAGIRTSSIYLPLVRTRMIEPTADYKNAPAMSPEHVAWIICRALYTKKSFAPWWLFFAQFGSVVFRRPAEFFMRRWVKSKENKKLERLKD
jgi:short-subunit dehydrogenase